MTKTLKIIAIIVAVVGIGLAIGYLGTRGGPPLSTSQQPAVSSAPRSSAAPIPLKTAPASTTPSSVQVAANASPGPADVPTNVPPGNLITNWEDKLDDVLGAEVPETQKAKQLAELFPRLPPDGQVEVAQHLSNLVNDEDYALLRPFATNSALPEAVLDVLLSDLFNRPNNMKLPTLVDIASDPKNPKASEAKDVLELYLDHDYGSDWATWRTKTQQWLTENPD